MLASLPAKSAAEPRIAERTPEQDRPQFCVSSRPPRTASKLPLSPCCCQAAPQPHVPPFTAQLPQSCRPATRPATTRLLPGCPQMPQIPPSCPELSPSCEPAAPATAQPPPSYGPAAPSYQPSSAKLQPSCPPSCLQLPPSCPQLPPSSHPVSVRLPPRPSSRPAFAQLPRRPSDRSQRTPIVADRSLDRSRHPANAHGRPRTPAAVELPPSWPQPQPSDRPATAHLPPSLLPAAAQLLPSCPPSFPQLPPNCPEIVAGCPQFLPGYRPVAAQLPFICRPPSPQLPPAIAKLPPCTA